MSLTARISGRDHEPPSGGEVLERTKMSQQKRTTVGATALSAALVLTACSGAGGGGGGDAVAEETADSINVIMVNNPQMVDLQELTEEHFTAETGITVNYTVLPENDVRDRISQEFSSQSGQYDVATISNYEVPIFGTNEWLAPLDEFAEGDAEFALDDILGPITESMRGPDGDLFGIPFYGESSFTMYRTDVFDELGLTMPDNPTWEEIAELAEQVHTSDAGMSGICLRGQPGWGQIFAPLTTVVNTFGGTWFESEEQNSTSGMRPMVNSPRVHRGCHVLRRPGPRARSARRPELRLRRVPEQPDPGQLGDVVRRHLGRRLAGGRRLPGPGPARLRARTGGRDRQRGLA